MEHAVWQPDPIDIDLNVLLMFCILLRSRQCADFLLTVTNSDVNSQSKDTCSSIYLIPRLTGPTLSGSRP